MRRRELLALIAGLAAEAPLAGPAQQKPIRAIGFLHSSSSDRSLRVVAAFRQGLREAGYIEGRNVAIEYRWADGNYARLPSLAADLVNRKVDVIVTGDDAPVLGAAKNATATIPIVFAIVADSMTSDLVASLARPADNVTGVSVMGFDPLAKRLELIAELAPQARVIALLVKPDFLAENQRMISDLQAGARRKGIELRVVSARTEGELNAAFASLAQLKAGALVMGSDRFFDERRDKLVALALRHAVPAIYDLSEAVAAGGLISFGISHTALYRRAAVYVSRILAGARPADLPAEQLTGYELAINLKTAKALGLPVPPALLARADEVVQ